MTSKKLWIVIADGARARVLERESADSGLHEVKGLDLRADHRPSHEILSDKPPRAYDRVGAARHAMEPRVDPHRELKRSFAHEVAAILDTRLAQHAFNRLVLVAPPQVLGDLRNALSHAVRAKLTAELAKDLTKVPDSELASHLEGVVRL